MSPVRSLSLVIALLGVFAGCTSTASAPPTGSRATRSPDLITPQELSAASAANAYELVLRLRATWLRSQTVGTISGNIGAMVAYTLVYLDNAKIGTIETLRSISAGGITSILWLSAERAAATLPGVGRDAINGAIVISTK